METKPSQGRHHFAGNKSSRFKSETFTQGRTNCGSSLNDNMLGRVIESRPDLINLVFFADRANRANRAALAALHANDIVEIALKCRANDSFKAATLRE